MVGLAARRGLSLVEAHPQTMEVPVLKMREVVESGELGRVRMIHNWTYSAWLYQPRMPEELDTKLGGGVTFRQGAHQFDILRLIGGGVVRSVRAMTGRWDPARPTEGAHTAFLDFADGTVATAIFSGYDRFHSSELTFGLGQGGTPETETEYAAARRRSGATGEEAELKRLRGYGLANSTPREHKERGQPFYGLTIVSCERGDMRQSRHGLLIYGEEQKREVPLSMHRSGRDFVLDEVYRSVVEREPCVHDGAWALATLELTLAVLQSGRERAEVMLRHQAPLGVTMSKFLNSH
jgi:phthalate 4,5-cis-dihydrodiol dehydrogenase